MREDYGDELLVAFRHLPLDFHDQAEPAARAAVAAHKQKKFWAYHDELFKQHENLSESVFLEIAQELSLDIELFKKDMASEDTAALIRADKILAGSAEINGTPAFLINGRKMLGALPLATFKSTIDSELSKVNGKIAKGSSIAQARGEVSELNMMRTPRADGGSGALRSLQWVAVDGAPQKGGNDPLATIVVFSEFECPFCAKIDPTLERILKERKEDVRVVFRHYPLDFHKQAPLAAEASVEAHQQGRFWEFHDQLFANQDALTEADLLRHGKSAGLDLDKLKDALTTRKHKAAVNADMGLAAKVGVDSTPTLIINGRTLLGAQPYERVDALVENVIAQAKQLIATKKVPRKGFYQELKKALPKE